MKSYSLDLVRAGNKSSLFMTDLALKLIKFMDMTWEDSSSCELNFVKLFWVLVHGRGRCLSHYDKNVKPS